MLRINGEPFGNEEFHNGEAIYKGVTLFTDGYNDVQLQFEDNRDIANLQFAVAYLNNKCPGVEKHLYMRYIPYSRMDREIPEGNQLFSMKYFAELINKLKFDKVYVLDPHSTVSEKLLKNVYSMGIQPYVAKVVDNFKPDYLFFPDKGAFSKYPDILASIVEDKGIKCFYGTKKRDLANQGKLIEDAYELHRVPEDGLEGKRILIVDDLVSMGGTAYLAARTLKLCGASAVALYVSHCENGIFHGKLLKPEAASVAGSETAKDDLPWAGSYTIDKVYTTATTPLEQSNDNLVIVKL